MGSWEEKALSEPRGDRYLVLAWGSRLFLFRRVSTRAMVLSQTRYGPLNLLRH